MGTSPPGAAVGPDGTIYVATNSGVLYALDPTTGANRWTSNGGQSLGGQADLSTTPLVLPTGDVLWPGSADTLFELSPAGAKLWSHQFSTKSLSPTLSGTRVHLEQMGVTLSAFDVGARTPRLAWSLTVGTTSYGRTMVGPNGSIVTTAGRRVIDVADGGSSARILWRFTTAAPKDVSASRGTGGRVVVNTNDRNVCALRPSGALEWGSKETESYSSSSVS